MPQQIDWSGWLTLLSTTILGGVTIYFAFRTRQLELKQARQINREFDRELAAAETEAQRAASFRLYWDGWKKDNDLQRTLALYVQARDDMPHVETSRLQNPLAFHLPNVLEDARHGEVRFHVALNLLDMATGRIHMPNSPPVAELVQKAEAALHEAEEYFQRVLDAVTQKRATLRNETEN